MGVVYFGITAKNAARKLDKPVFIRLHAQLYNHALLPTHCSSALGKAWIFSYDPGVIEPDKLIKTSLSSKRSKDLSRSKSVGFHYYDNETSVTTTTSLSPLHSNRSCQLLKYPSDPTLFPGKPKK